MVVRGAGAEWAGGIMAGSRQAPAGLKGGEG